MRATRDVPSLIFSGALLALAAWLAWVAMLAGWVGVWPVCAGCGALCVGLSGLGLRVAIE